MNKKWEVDVDGEILKVDADILKDWLRAGRVGPASQVRRDSLRWISISSIPIFMEVLNRKAFPDPPGTASSPRGNRSETPRKIDSGEPARGGYGMVLAALFVCVLISGLAGFGWMQYSDYIDDNTPARKLGRYEATDQSSKRLVEKRSSESHLHSREPLNGEVRSESGFRFRMGFLVCFSFLVVALFVRYIITRANP